MLLKLVAEVQVSPSRCGAYHLALLAERAGGAFDARVILFQHI